MLKIMNNMKFRNYVLSIGVILFIMSCGGDSDDSSPGPIDPGGNTPVVPDENFDELVWSDEFDVNGSPDAEKWTYDLGDGCPDLCGWGNNEAQYYTDRPENVIVDDGLLKITLKKEAVEPPLKAPYLILVCLAKSSALSMGESIRSTVRKAARLAV